MNGCSDNTERETTLAFADRYLGAERVKRFRQVLRVGSRL